ncbi:phage minor capsid protein [Weissella confusa]|uniref:Capsid protein n=1 Tax=Weissella confusa TaxID=1583 RepID=A0AAJ2YY28_WEICO|nr:phage minor capsid protein [Weissella confusa]NBA12199.1 capsid protein [Weissella confusa]
MAKVNPDQMTMGASMVGDIYSQMAQELFLRMIQRIKQRGVADLQDNPYLWQLEKLNDMHLLNEENIQYVIEQTGIARELMDEIIQNEGLKVYQNTSEQLAAQLNKKTPQYNSVQDTLARYANQTFLDIDNLVNQTLITTNLGQNSAMRVYQEIIEQSVAEVTTGLKTADKAISDTVMKWIDKGIPSAFVDKGGNTWTIERYARTVMESTTYRVYNEMRTGAAEELGVTTFHMSSHAAARPACAPIQGHIVTKAQHSFDSGDAKVGRVYSLWEHGYGEPSGTMGINCHHVLTPFVIGVNEMPDEDIPDPKQAIANGEKQAKQRAYERGIRDAKYKIAAAKALGDEGLRKRYQALLDSRRAGLRNLIDDNDFLHRDYAREKIYSNQKLNLAYQEKMLKNEYGKLINKFGKPGMPSYFDYKTYIKNGGDAGRLWGNYIQARRKRTINPVVKLSDYQEVDVELHNALLGVVGSNGLKVTGNSYHLIDRVLGTSYDQENHKLRQGVPIDELKNAITNGEVFFDDKQYFFESDKARVVVNPDGNVVTVYPRSSKVNKKKKKGDH